MRQERAGLAVDEHRAGAADAVLAADMGAGEAELVAEEIGEEQADADVALDRLAVHGERDAHLRIGRYLAAASPSAVPRLIVSVLCRRGRRAFSTVRRTSVATTRRR